jgi:acyl-CoA synthetase (AMP-forming)/AMP-acid ligase II
MKAETIIELLKAGADDAPALSTPGGTPLSYGALRTLVAETVDALAGRGTAANDRVAIVLDNGPEMAAAFLSIGSGATAAPLNPGYRADEFEFYLTDLRATLLVVGKDKDSPCVAVAEKLGIPIARLVAHPDRGAGTFALEFAGSPKAVNRQPSATEAAHTVLVLHTSGTTSRPKIVPLSNANVCASAHNVAASLQLTESDRGLVIMPLFHIHGLIAALLAPLAVGGEVCCSTGFNALKFFSWLGETRPTWYSGVPTMHQAILTRVANNKDVLAAHRLRFIRSSSSSLPTRVITEVESVFGVPIIEAYGMTEAAHQMASNALPPKRRKPGTVGPSAGPEIRISDLEGKTVPTGATGEIVIRGPNVMKEYENNPTANADAFYGDWFRTGDQGTMDADGYVSITGRLKEIINRGGEKISPREVDEILMEHTAVHQCVTFGMPHDMLGEEVAAAVVLKQGAQSTEKELREFARVKLADFKVPKKILILETIPVGATGKLQRIGLAQKLGLG